MRIVVVVARFTVTGVPLAQARFARALASRGHEVEFIIGFVDKGTSPPVIEGVRVRVWRFDKVRKMCLPLMFMLRSNKPDIVFSAEDHLNVVLLLAAILGRSRAKVSGSSRISPTDRLAYSDRPFSKGWILKKVMELVIWRADALTCVSQEMVGYYQRIFDHAPHVCVYNIVNSEDFLSRVSQDVVHPWLLNKVCPVVISAGTMTRRKGFQDLIHAFRIASSKRSLRLILLGDGYLRVQLSDLLNELGISGKVSMPGSVENPLKYFARSDVFVLSSYSEGMPNALVEAMMCGCTPVATDCPTGPREVLNDGKYGYLVPLRNPQAMAAAIEQALDNPIPRALLTEAVKPFEEKRVIDRHFEVLGL